MATTNEKILAKILKEVANALGIHIHNETLDAIAPVEKEAE